MSTPSTGTSLTRRLLMLEVVLVLAVSLGRSGVYALVNFIGSLTAHQSLGKQTAVLNGSLAPGRPLLDLTLQLLNVTLSLAPVLLVFYLLARAGEGPSAIGVDAREPGLFHLTLDSTAIPFEDCLEIIAEAARRKALRAG